MSWRGSHIQVDRTATGKLVSSWWRCCACNRELVRGQDIEDGLHWRCRQRLREGEADMLRNQRRPADRARYRQDLDEGKMSPN
jgi:hypothetical protein